MSEDASNEPRASASAPPPPPPEVPPEDPSTWTEADHLRHFLKGRDAKCPECHYNLRDLESAKCPECGNALRLGVGLGATVPRYWLVLVVALCAPMGLGAYSLFILLNVLLYGSPTGVGETIICLAMFYDMACIPLGSCVIACRRRFIELDTETQGLLACVGCTATGISLVALFLAVMSIY